jgi:hypothetical protein
MANSEGTAAPLSVPFAYEIERKEILVFSEVKILLLFTLL